jgi:hypothetical protein
MKRIVTAAGLAFASFVLHGQGIPFDPNAIFILDKMSDVIGGLNSCSYTLTTSLDVNDFDHGVIKQHGVSKVYLVGPDKMLVNTSNYKGNRTFAFNGKQMAYYSHDENNYAIVDAPPTIVETIVQINHDYGLEFPAADFFYPTFTDDLMEHSEQIRLLGKVNVEGEECFHILAMGKELHVQIWISHNAFMLPKKFVITYLKEGNSQFAASFSEWSINPDLPAAIFEFLPPSGAAEVRLIPRKSK